jgi:drug/metabolite transporter (DMT)-like permease
VLDIGLKYRGDRVMHSEKIKGICCIISAAFCFALMNLFIKLAGDIPTPEKAFFRNLVAVFLAAGVLYQKKIPLRCEKKAIPWVAGRALFGTIALLANFYAIDHLNISDASMLNKLSPFFAIIYSYFLLKEKAEPYQILCTITAIGGAVFILKPGSSSILSIPALIGFSSGMCAGLAYTMLRKASKLNVHGSFIVFVFSAFSCFCCVPLCLFHFSPLGPKSFLFLMLTGIAACGGQFSITAAYTHAPASELSVFDYTQIFFAGMLGFLFLGEVPDLMSWIGYFVIIGAAVIMFIDTKKKQ